MSTPEELTKQHYPNFSRGYRLESLVCDLWRNYPLHAATWGECLADGCKNGARGHGLCASCITKCLGYVCGDDAKAERFHEKIKAVRRAERAVRDAITNRQ